MMIGRSFMKDTTYPRPSMVRILRKVSQITIAVAPLPRTTYLRKLTSEYKKGVSTFGDVTDLIEL